MPKHSSGHIVELQSLRGVAATLVMIGHALSYFRAPAWIWSHGYTLFNGRGAVVVFFVLSGFVLTRSLARAPLSPSNVARFYLARVFRIYPAIWTASFLGLLYLLFLHWRVPVIDVGDGVARQFRPDRMDALHIIASFAGMLAFILPQLWSITDELFASLTLPFVAAIAFRSRRWFCLLFLMTIIASVALSDRTYYNVGMYYVDFVIGAGLSILPQPVESFLHRMPRVSSALLALATLLLVPSQFLPLTYYSPWANLYEATLASLVIAILSYSTSRVKFMSSRPMVFLGDISYSVYLLHYVVICTLAKIIVVLWGPRLSGVEIAFATLGLALIVPAVTIPLAWLSYTFVELPGVQLGKQVTAWGRRVISFRQVQTP